MSRSEVRVRLSGQQLVTLLVVALLVAAFVGWLVLDLGRGARDDLAGTRDGVAETVETGHRTLDRLDRQLRSTRRSLRVQQAGLRVAARTSELTETGVRSTERIETQTTRAVHTLDRVIAALGPLERLRGDLDSVVSGVEAGVALARSALAVAEDTLLTGQHALAVAEDTLRTLDRSEEVQRALLEVARATLAEVREINRKIPVPPVFPTP